MRTGQAIIIARHFAAARWRWERLRGQRLSGYQERRAREIVRFANERSPFYREHWSGYDLAGWRALPTVDKRLMMANFARFNTIGVSADEALEVALRAERNRDFTPTLRGVTVGLSSGTSGHRGVFLASPEEQTGWAGVILARTLHQFTGRLRVAFFLRSNSNLYEQVGGTLIQFQYFDLMTADERSGHVSESVPAAYRDRPTVVAGRAGGRVSTVAPAHSPAAADLGRRDAGAAGPASAYRARFQAPVHEIDQ